MSADDLLDYEALAAELRILGVMVPPCNANTLRLLERLSDNLERYLDAENLRKALTVLDDYPPRRRESR
jgi:hypothetical protein